MAKEKSIIINAVDRALDVLIYLYNINKEVGITEISKDLGIYKSTIFRTLATLENKDFVTQNPKTGKYFLGKQLFIIGLGIDKKYGIIEIIKPYAKDLHEKFHEQVNVSVLEKNQMGVYKSVIIYKEENFQILQFNSQIGSMNDCYCAGVGKCLLAYGDGVDLSVYDKYQMKKYTEKTISSVTGLKKELKKIRKNGYALDDEEREVGLTCIAVPIMKNGYAIAAISISGPTSRMRENQFEYKIGYLKKIGKKISDKLT